VLAPANRALLRERGFVLWLQASVEQQLQRLARDRKRPLLDAPDRRERLQQLALERDPVYAELADCSVGGAGESCDHAAARIATLLETQWQRKPAVEENA
jgi:shikimate kinase